MRATWPTWCLAERDDELAAVAGHVLGARGVVLIGPPGCGRTRLARETVDRARAAGRVTAWAAGTEGARELPLGALSHLVPPGSGDPGEMLRRTLAALTGPARSLVLAIDDAHLLDPLSATLLLQLGVSDGVALLVTMRSGAAGEDGLASLWKDGTLARIDVGPLNRPAADRLLTTALGGDVDARTGERLWRLTRGVPRHLREIVEAGLAAGRLTADGGPWHWSGPIEPDDRVVDVARAEIGPVDAAAERVLALLALAGRLSVERLVGLAGHDAVADLERRGLLTAGARWVRLTHPLHALVLRRIMPAATAAALRAELPVEEVGDVLRAASRGEVPRAEASVVGAAAQRALARGDLLVAEKLARVARAPAPAAEAALGQGRLAEARVLARDVPDLAPVVAALIGDGADSALSSTSPAALAAAALVELRTGAPGRAAVLGDPLLGGAPSAARTLAAAVVAAGRAAAGDDGGARAALRVATPASGPLAATARIALTEARLVVDLAAGRLADVESSTRTRYRRALAADGGPQDALATLHLGRAALTAGRLPRAVRLLTEAHAALRRADPAGLRGLCAAELAQARILLGEPDRAAFDEDDGRRWAATAWALARAWFAATTGGDPQPVLRQAVDATRGRGDTVVEAQLWHVAARLGDAAGAAPALAALAAGRHAHVVRLAEHAAALDADSGPRLDAVAATFADAGALLVAADAAAAAAAAHTRAGLRRPASRSAARAADLAGRCGHPRTPALVALAPPRLTRRELEVARLVVEGSTSSDVARQLVLSVRTVEAHVAHAYAKLGVHDRAGLRAALPDTDG